MYEFKDIFTQFIENKCEIDDNVKIKSRELFDSFNNWLESNCITYDINITVFSVNVKKYFPQFPYKRIRMGRVFTGLCLKQNYKTKHIPNYKQVLDRRREYARNYYHQNKDIIRQQQKQHYDTKCIYDQELMKRCNITEEQLYKRKKLGLVKHIFNMDNTLNWSETINAMEKRVENFKQQHKEEEEHNQVHTTSQNIQPRAKLKIITNPYQVVDTTYDIDIVNLTKHGFIQFKKWFNEKSDEIWTLKLPVTDKNRMLDEFYDKYNHIDDRFEELYSNDTDYDDIIRSTQSNT